jgi:hypothetical protein
MYLCVVANGSVLSVLFLSCSSAENKRSKNDKHEQMTDVCDMRHDMQFSKWRAN